MAVNESLLREMELEDAARQLIKQQDAGYTPGDYGLKIGSGLASTAEGIGQGLDYLGLSGIGGTIKDYSQQAEDAINKRYSVGAQYDMAQGKNILQSAHPFQRLVATAAESLPAMAVGIGTPFGLARLGTAGLKAVGVARTLEPGIASLAAGEGLTAGLVDSAQVSQRLNRMPQDQLDQVPAYQSALAQLNMSPSAFGMSDEDKTATARTQASRSAGFDVFWQSALSVGLLAGVPGYFGQGMLPRFLRTPAGAPVAEGSLGSRIGRTAGAESLIEGAQQATETPIANVALGRPATENLGNSVIDAMLVGGLYGGAFGGLHRQTPVAATPDQGTTDATTETPDVESRLGDLAAAYDPTLIRGDRREEVFGPQTAEFLKNQAEKARVKAEVEPFRERGRAEIARILGEPSNITTAFQGLLDQKDGRAKAQSEVQSKIAELQTQKDALNVEGSDYDAALFQQYSTQQDALRSLLDALNYYGVKNSSQLDLNTGAYSSATEAHPGYGALRAAAAAQTEQNQAAQETLQNARIEATLQSLREARKANAGELKGALAAQSPELEQALESVRTNALPGLDSDTVLQVLSDVVARTSSNVQAARAKERARALVDELKARNLGQTPTQRDTPRDKAQRSFVQAYLEGHAALNDQQAMRQAFNEAAPLFADTTSVDPARAASAAVEENQRVELAQRQKAAEPLLAKLISNAQNAEENAAQARAFLPQEFATELPLGIPEGTDLLNAARQNISNEYAQEQRNELYRQQVPTEAGPQAAFTEPGTATQADYAQGQAEHIANQQTTEPRIQRTNKSLPKSLEGKTVSEARQFLVSKKLSRPAQQAIRDEIARIEGEQASNEVERNGFVNDLTEHLTTTIQQPGKPKVRRKKKAKDPLTDTATATTEGVAPVETQGKPLDPDTGLPNAQAWNTLRTATEAREAQGEVPLGEQKRVVYFQINGGQWLTTQAPKAAGTIARYVSNLLQNRVDGLHYLGNLTFAVEIPTTTEGAGQALTDAVNAELRQIRTTESSPTGEVVVKNGLQMYHAEAATDAEALKKLENYAEGFNEAPPQVIKNVPDNPLRGPQVGGTQVGVAEADAAQNFVRELKAAGYSFDEASDLVMAHMDPLTGEYDTEKLAGAVEAALKKRAQARKKNGGKTPAAEAKAAANQTATGNPRESAGNVAPTDPADYQSPGVNSLVDQATRLGLITKIKNGANFLDNLRLLSNVDLAAIGKVAGRAFPTRPLKNLFEAARAILNDTSFTTDHRPTVNALVNKIAAAESQIETHLQQSGQGKFAAFYRDALPTLGQDLRNLADLHARKAGKADADPMLSMSAPTADSVYFDAGQRVSTLIARVAQTSTDPEVRQEAQQLFDTLYNPDYHHRLLESHANVLTRGLKGKGRIVVVQYQHQLPQRVQQRARIWDEGGLVKGAYDPVTQTTYMVTSNLANAAEMEFVAGHELFGHRGFDGVLGPQRRTVMEGLYETEPLIRPAADAYMKSRKMDKATAVEEAAADLAARGVNLTGFRKLGAALESGFRKLGLTRLANWIRAKNGSRELLGLLSEARAFVTRGGEMHAYTEAHQDVLFNMAMPDHVTPSAESWINGFLNDAWEGAQNVRTQIMGFFKNPSMRAVRNMLQRHVYMPLHIARSNESAGYTNFFDNVIRPRDQVVNYYINQAGAMFDRTWGKPGIQRDADFETAKEALLAWNDNEYSRTEFMRTPEYTKLSDRAKQLVSIVRNTLERASLQDVYADAARAQSNFDTRKEWEAYIKTKLDYHDQLMDKGYIPNRRYGKYAIGVRAKATNQHIYWARFENQAEAEAALQATKAHFANDPHAIVDDAVQTVNTVRGDHYDTASFWNLVEAMREAGTPMTGAQISALAKKVIQADALAHNKLTRRKQGPDGKGIPGYSPDVPRAVAEYVTSQSHRAGSMLLASRQTAALSMSKNNAGSLITELKELQRDYGKYLGLSGEDLNVALEKDFGVKDADAAQAKVRRLRMLQDFQDVEALRKKYGGLAGMTDSAAIDDVLSRSSNRQTNALELGDLMRLRAVEAHGRELWKQDGPGAGHYQDLARELVNSLRAPVSSWASRSRGAAALIFLGGNLSSAAVNFLGLPMFTVPYLAGENWAGSMLGATTALNRGVADAFGNYSLLTDLARLEQVLTNKGTAKDKATLQELGIDQDMLRSLVRAHKEDILGARITNELVGLAKGNVSGPWGKRFNQIKNAWMMPFTGIEQVNRIATFLAAYRIGKEKGMKGAELDNAVRQAIDETQSLPGPLNYPGIARSNLGHMLFTFKSFPIGMFELMRRSSMPQKAMMVGMIILLAGLKGLPLEDTADDLVNTIAARGPNALGLGQPFNFNRFLVNMLNKAGGVVGADTMGDFLMRGAFDSATGYSIRNRVGLMGLIPGTNALLPGQEFWNDTMKRVFGPVGGEFENATNAIRQATDGDFAGSADVLSLFRNARKAMRMAETGEILDRHGKLIAKDATPVDAAMQLVGFTASRAQDAYDAYQADRYKGAFHDEMVSHFLDRMRIGMHAQDQEAVRSVYEDVKAWNLAHPDMPVTMSRQQLRSLLAESGQTLTERAQKLLPREWRGRSTYQ